MGPLRAKKPRKSHLSLTSLIDVIFLLLLFFMFSTNFSRYVEMPLGSGAAGQNSAEPDQETNPVLVELGAGEVHINFRAVSGDALETTLRDLQTQAPMVVYISPEEGVSTQELINVYQMANRLENTDALIVAAKGAEE